MISLFRLCCVCCCLLLTTASVVLCSKAFRGGFCPCGSEGLLSLYRWLLPPCRPAGIYCLPLFCREVLQFGVGQHIRTAPSLLRLDTPSFHRLKSFVRGVPPLSRTRLNCVFRSGQACEPNQFISLFRWRADNYDRLSGAAGWARDSLETHANDPREWTYSLQELEEGKTHEDLWNAAQLQLVSGFLGGLLHAAASKRRLQFHRSCCTPGFRFMGLVRACQPSH